MWASVRLDGAVVDVSSPVLGVGQDDGQRMAVAVFEVDLDRLSSLG